MSKQPCVQDIYNFIDQIAPFDTAEPWDNVGLLIGSAFATASKVLLALDITEEVVEEAIDGQYELIITHHPIIFTGIKTITTEDRLGRLLQRLIQNRISVIAAHTNLDRSFDFGINRTIAEHFQLEMVQPLNVVHQFGLIGRLPKAVPFDRFIEQTKSIFGIKIVKVSNFFGDNLENSPEDIKMIQNVALSSGASSDFIQDARAMNADVFITSDLKYHEAQTVIGSGLILVDVGHFESERLFMIPFKSQLEAHAKKEQLQLVVHVTKTEMPVFTYL